ncbi:MAG: histone H1 [Deltaproteobacteria bacterium HGW-Deltaproteobacteria-6]|jgi:hypothetical protein|nr:MAG: histone H1 [Deltaproteobacteria bacterium HGW-Deltaproteobacteria-6]
MKKIKNLPKDANKRAFEIVRISTEESEEQPERSEISKYLAEIGRKGGLKGGKARKDKLTPERRKEIAENAAAARWSKS